MLNQKYIHEYKNIKAPSDLKKKILADCKERESRQMGHIISTAVSNGRFVKSLSAIAACLVLVFVAYTSIISTQNTIQLSYGDTVISESPIKTETGVAKALYSQTTEITLQLKTNSYSEISISHGELFKLNTEGEQTACGNKISTKENIAFIWNTDNTQAKQELTITQDKKVTVYVFEVSESAPNGVIYKK